MGVVDSAKRNSKNEKGAKRLIDEVPFGQKKIRPVQPLALHGTTLTLHFKACFFWIIFSTNTSRYYARF